VIWPIGMKTLLGDPRENENLHLAGDKPISVGLNDEKTGIVSVYKPEPPKSLPDSLVEAISRNDVKEAWRDAVADAERPGRGKEPDSWGVLLEDIDKNGIKTGSKAYGRYQMRKGALQDAGMMRKDGSWTGKYGITNEIEFLNNPAAQDAALKDLADRIDGYIRDENHNGRIGKTIKGVLQDFKISQSSLVAAAHRQGIGRIGEYFAWLEKNGWNSRDNIEALPEKQKRQFKSVEYRLRTFRDVPYK
jgi:hypothetical protein